MSASVEYKVPTRNNIIEDIYSRISKLITPYFLNTNLTPNHITIISGIFGIIGALMLFINQHEYLILSSFLIQIYAILDLVDGDIARIKKLQSNFGMWLDIFFDKLIDFLIVLSISLGVFFETKDPMVLILGIALMGILFFNQFIMVLNDTVFKASRENNIKDEYEKKYKQSFAHKIIYSTVSFFRAHLALQHNTFLLLVSLFAIFNLLKIGMIFLLFHASISILLSIIINFIKIK